MDCTDRKTQGQAIVELTLVVTLILTTVSMAIALTATLRKELKHSFIKTDPTPSEKPDEIEGLKDLVRLFPRQPRAQTILQLEQSGWGEDRRLKIPQGLVVLMTRGDEKMSVIATKGEQIGVYYK